MSSWVMVLCLSLLSLRRLPVLYLLPSARRISSTTNPMIPLIINMPFLSLNPKKLCLDLRLGRPPAIPAGQLLDKLTARRSPERTTSHRAARMPSPWRRPEPPQGRMNLTWSSEIGGRRTSNAGNPCNCWTGGTERLVQDNKKKKKKDWNVSRFESPKELQTHYIGFPLRSTLRIHVCQRRCRTNHASISAHQYKRWAL